MWKNSWNLGPKPPGRFGNKGGNVPIPFSIGPGCIPSCLSHSRPSQHREFWFQRMRLEKPIPTFSPLSPWDPGAPISPWKTTNPQENQSQKFIIPRDFPFPLCSSCPHSCCSFWQISMEESLISSTRIPTMDWEFSCAVGMQREKHKSQRKDKSRVSLSQDRE